MVIVFSGFRDDQLKEQIEAKGGKVASSMIKDTTHLLIKKDAKPSKKVEDAKAKGIKTIELDDFIDEHEFTLADKKPRGRPKKSADPSDNDDAEEEVHVMPDEAEVKPKKKKTKDADAEKKTKAVDVDADAETKPKMDNNMIIKQINVLMAELEKMKASLE